MGRLFGTDGVRGVAGEDLTSQLAMDLATAAAGMLQEMRAATVAPRPSLPDIVKLTDVTFATGPRGQETVIVLLRESTNLMGYRIDYSPISGAGSSPGNAHRASIASSRRCNSQVRSHAARMRMPSLV